MTAPLADALVAAYARITEVVEGPAEPDFARPTRATRWTVRDLVFHQSVDAVRALAAFASPTDDPADVDEVTYWRPFSPDRGDGGAAHARFVQVSASAFSSGRSLAQWWQMVAPAAARAAGAADPARRVRTQGHVLAVPDFVSTLLVEVTVHHLDLVLDLPGAPQPAPAALAETRRVLGGLLGAPLPTTWDDTEAALKGTGRLPLTDADRTALGDRAGGVPLLG